MHALPLASSTRGLPITASLAPATLASLVIALLIAGVSSVGLLFPSAVYLSAAARLAFMPSDGFMLALGLPLLLGAVALAWRGSLVGLLAWPGVLFMVLYLYLPYVTGAPVSALFLPHLALVAISAVTLISLVATIDGEAVYERLDSGGPARAGGGILVGLALFIVIRQVVVISAAFASQAEVDPIERASWIADFVVAVPALLVIGVQLWRRTALGYAAGPGLLFGYGLLALSVLPFFVAQAQAEAVPRDWAGVAVILAMTAICFVPFGLIVRRAGKSRSVNLGGSE